MKCPNCGSDNKENSKFCFKCGFKLLQPAPQPLQKQIPVMQQQPSIVPHQIPVVPHQITVVPEHTPVVPQQVQPVSSQVSAAPNISRETVPVSLPAAPPQDLSTRPLISASLFFKDSSKEISLPFKPLVYIGRVDKQSGNNPEIDLTDMDTAKTTSRKHSYIVFTNGKYKIADTGSMNGTFLNGVKLDKDVEYEIKSGDEIVFGKLSCIFSSTV